MHPAPLRAAASPEAKAIYNQAEALLRQAHALIGTLPHIKDEHGKDRLPVFILATLGIHDSDGVHSTEVCAARGDDRMAIVGNILSGFPPPIRFMLAMESTVKDEAQTRDAQARN